MSEPWHLRKELSIGTIISLALLGIGSTGAYYTAMAQIKNNAENLQGVPERITRLEERIANLQLMATESQRVDQATLQALQALQIQLARLQAQLERNE